MTPNFQLDPQLTQDSLLISDRKFSQLRLVNRQDLLWLVLVPKVADITELYELSHTQQQMLLADINHISQLIKTHFICDKLNIATLGNITAQLHIHIIARRKDDPFWPNATFGTQGTPYSADAAQVLLEKIKALL